MITQPRKMLALVVVAIMFTAASMVSIFGGASTTPSARADVPSPASHSNFGDCAFRNAGTGPNTNKLEDSYCWLSAEKLISGKPISVGEYELQYDAAFVGSPGHRNGSVTSHVAWDEAAFGKSIFPPNSENDPAPIIQYEKDVVRRGNRGAQNAIISLSNIRLVGKNGNGGQVNNFSLAFADAETSDKPTESWSLSADADDVIATGKNMGFGGQGSSRGRGNSNSCRRSFSDAGTSFRCEPQNNDGGSFAVTMKNPKNFNLQIDLRTGGNPKQAVAFAIVMDRVGGDVHPKVGERPELTELESRYTGERTEFDLTATVNSEPVPFEDGSYGLVPHAHKIHRYDAVPRDHAIEPDADLVFSSQAINGDQAKALYRYRPEWTCRIPGISIDGIDGANGITFREPVKLERFSPDGQAETANYNQQDVNGHKNYLDSDAIAQHGIEMFNDPATGTSQVRIAAGKRNMGGTYCEVEWIPRFELAELHLSKTFAAASDYHPGGEAPTAKIGYQCTVDRRTDGSYNANSTTFSNDDLRAAYPDYFLAKSPENQQDLVLRNVVDVPVDGQPVIATVPERLRCGIFEDDSAQDGLEQNINVSIKPHPNARPGNAADEFRGKMPKIGPGEFETLNFYVNRKDEVPSHGAVQHSRGGLPVNYAIALENNYLADRAPVTMNYEFIPENNPEAILGSAQTKQITSHLTCDHVSIVDQDKKPVPDAHSGAQVRRAEDSIALDEQQNFHEVPRQRLCKLEIEESADGPRPIDRKLYLNGEEVPPGMRTIDNTDNAPLVFLFKLPEKLPEGQNSHQLRLVSDYRPRELKFTVDKLIEGREPFNVGRSALLPHDATVMPMTLKVRNDADFSLPAGDSLSLTDASLAGYRVTVGGTIENFAVSGGEEFTIPEDGNLEPIRHCFAGADGADIGNLRETEAIPAETELTCQLAVHIPAEAGDNYSYDGDAFTVTATADGQEPKTEQSSYGATKLSQLIDQMLPNTGVQTMVWILGLGLLALLFGLWRYLRDDKEEN
ncbi:LPXTG cell wall anchor domain-containing protein [Corynebacterium pseudodiphtheriticum]|uniref:LPXTG cell wall anchor domain-containing protein n=1 Tax=Corynebacterium TaxID=1716 RepID=UPI0025434816|nr:MULTISPECIES: LPXTG cell wall anchor domain-containing protein [Corynebacterium]MDK4244168.1 LPXTG cell wall anchor domain-containing protein [Corynebacterium pseudodiphtheriticum]MDK4318490.1 LPXTG cell wall anchor domain-containing protein [Corynebacterium pseudodiphtheriticum]WKS43330.1 LPXTG cell wall anchor domain-containing protein [Corynebacterium propinquum]WKS46724.1 LPXTG cell wall anchor domain-containing protein [Corynebacterium propinquum]